MQLWLLFGVNSEAPLHQYLDNRNTYLPENYKNTGGYYRDKPQEQMHHYLGGVTGDLDNSHLLNYSPLAWYKELAEEKEHGSFNQGDYDLFTASRPHRDEFVRNYPNGRFTVAPNIRKLLLRRSV